MLLVPSKHESNFLFTYYYLQNTTDTKESLENELAKVTKDRDLSMKKKDELAGILSQAAQALRASLAVSYFFFSLWAILGRFPFLPILRQWRTHALIILKLLTVVRGDIVEVLSSALLWDAIVLWVGIKRSNFYDYCLVWFRGTQQEYSSKPLKHCIVKRILVFKR